MKHRLGNLCDLAEQGYFDLIVHGCNCQCHMGAGIAKEIRRRYPTAWEADRVTVAGDAGKLGSFSRARIELQGHSFEVVNAYTQLDWRGSAMGGVIYDAVRSAFAAIRERYTGLRIGYPRIGAGLAGGNWDIIADMIDYELQGEDHTLVILPAK